MSAPLLGLLLASEWVVLGSEREPGALWNYGRPVALLEYFPSKNGDEARHFLRQVVFAS